MGKILTNIKRNSDGLLITEQGNTLDDFLNHTGKNTEATGSLLIGNTNENNLFIPNDVEDKVAIIDATIELCNALLNEPIGTTVVQGVPVNLVLTTSYKNGINQVINNLQSIKEELK